MKYLTTLFMCAVFLGGCNHTNVAVTSETSLPANVQAQDYRYREAGSGGPVVVFEYGISDSLVTWESVQDEVSQYTETFSYNRAGYKGSPRAVGTRDARAVVGELRALLAQRGLSPPYLLVGHSVGGLYTQYYARNFPDEVAGLVLIDSSHWDQSARMPRTGFSVWGAVLQMVALWGVAGQEADAFENTQRQVRESPPLRPMPLVVLSAGLQGELWHDMQRELAAQSPNSLHIIAEGSGHSIQREQPDLVSTAVRDIVELLRDN